MAFEKLKMKHSEWKFNTQDIAYIYVMKGLAMLTFEDGSQEVIEMPLFRLEDMLGNHLFFRVHKSYIVNLLKVNELCLKDNQLNILLDGMVVPVARRKRRHLLRLLGAVN